MADEPRTTSDKGGTRRMISQSLTDRGLTRVRNEDAGCAIINDHLTLLCIADGMGGYENGEYASSEIIRTVRCWAAMHQNEGTGGQILDSFLNCIQNANKTIFNTYNQGQSVCGSTIAALLVGEGVSAVINVGDSHVYRKRGFRFEQLSTDDVWQNQPDIADLKLSFDQLRSHADYGKLTAAVGTDQELIPHVRSIPVRKQDVFLLCTDGVYKTCDERWLGHIVNPAFAGNSPRKTTEHLEHIVTDIKSEVYRKGAPDNLTVIVAQVQ